MVGLQNAPPVMMGKSWAKVVSREKKNKIPMFPLLNHKENIKKLKSVVQEMVLLAMIFECMLKKGRKLLCIGNRQGTSFKLIQAVTCRLLKRISLLLGCRFLKMVSTISIGGEGKNDNEHNKKN